MNMTAELLPLPESEGHAQVRLVCEALAARGFSVPPLVMLEALAHLSARPVVGVATEFELIQHDAPVAGCSGPRLEAIREILHYASLYAQDGPVEIYEVTRTERLPEELMAALTKEPK